MGISRNCGLEFGIGTKQGLSHAPRLARRDVSGRGDNLTGESFEENDEIDGRSGELGFAEAIRRIGGKRGRKGRGRRRDRE